MTINFDTLFGRIGKFLYVARKLDDSAAAELVTNLRAAEEELDTEQHDFQQAVLGALESSLDQQLVAIGSMTTQLVGVPVQNLIVETVHADTPLVNRNLDTALAVLIEQMDDQAESVDSSTITATVTYGENSSSSGTGDNWGNGILFLCTQRGDGQINQHILAETIRCEITAVSSGGTATWTLQGEPAVPGPKPTWPGGSGTNRSLASQLASSGLVPNGDLETSDDYATGLPKYWVLSVGTLGTHVRQTSTEQQTVTINGTPTGGYYTLKFQDRLGDVHTTVPLTYNASASAVQAALRQLPTLGSVTVTSTGTGANLTHTVVFTGVTNPAQLQSTSALTGGTPVINHATTVASSPWAARGARCLEFVGDGSTLTTIQVPVALTGRTCYAFNLWAVVDVTPAAGVLTIDLVDGIGDEVVADDQGTNNTTTLDLTALGTSHQAATVAFHTPTTMPPQCYLRLRLTTALSNGSSLFVDELCLVAMQELYAGGLWAAGFSGPEDFRLGDYAEITVANDRGGELHEWLNRLLGLASKRILLPVASPGTQPDSLIA